MIDYLLKSNILLLVCYVLYHLVQKENNLIFNRYYLLGSLIFSLVLPLMHFEIIPAHFIQLPIQLQTASVYNGGTPAPMSPGKLVVSTRLNYQQFIRIFYTLITVILACRFVFNFIRLINKSRSNNHIRYKGYKLILLDHPVNIHSFLNTIFLGVNDHGSELDTDLIEHELTHIRQFHTLDIIFLEIVQVFYWFNPLIYFIKSAIKINHEFLADAGLELSTGRLKEYSEKILNYTVRNTPASLASGFNHTILKKRLLMLKTRKDNRMKNYKLFIIGAIVISALLAVPSYVIGGQDTNVSQKEAIKMIKHINREVHYHNGSINVLQSYAENSYYNFDTYVLITKLISSFGYHTKPAMEIAQVVFFTDHECELFNDIAILVFLHTRGPNDGFVELANEASQAKTESGIAKIRQQIEVYKQKSEFKSIDEALEYQTKLFPLKNRPTFEW